MSHSDDLFGVLPIDKPTAMTSRDVVNVVQRILRPHISLHHAQVRSGISCHSARPKSRKLKVGHTGTLDPLATGVLLVVIGAATRMVQYAHYLTKTYEADFILGACSDTLDSTGQVQELSCPSIIERQVLEEELPRWVGEIQQTPPKFSAVHVAGERAHELARKGVDFDLPHRKVTIHKLELLDFEYPRFSLRVCCSTGTYIRTLGSSIAKSLATDAIMSRLVRTDIGPFHLSHCVALADLQSISDIKQVLQSPVGLLQQMPKIELHPEGCIQLRQGKTVELDRAHCMQQMDSPEVAILDSWQQPVAVGSIENKLLKPIRVFQS